MPQKKEKRKEKKGCDLLKGGSGLLKEEGPRGHSEERTVA